MFIIRFTIDRLPSLTHTFSSHQKEIFSLFAFFLSFCSCVFVVVVNLYFFSVFISCYICHLSFVRSYQFAPFCVLTMNEARKKTNHIENHQNRNFSSSVFCRRDRLRCRYHRVSLLCFSLLISFVSLSTAQ